MFIGNFRDMSDAKIVYCNPCVQHKVRTNTMPDNKFNKRFFQVSKIIC